MATNQNPKSIYAAIFMSYFPIKLLGYAPFSLFRRNGQWICRTSRVGLAYNILHIAVTFCIYINAVFYWATFIEVKPVLSVMDVFTQEFLAFSCAILGIITHTINQHKIISSLSSLHAIDLKLASSNVQVPHIKNKRSLIKYFLICAIVILFMCFMDIFLSGLDAIYFKYSYWIGLYYPVFMNDMLVLQFAFFVLAVKQRLWLINQRLRLSDSKDLKFVLKVAPLHNGLCQISGAVNQVFGPPLLVMVAMVIVNIVTNTNFLLGLSGHITYFESSVYHYSRYSIVALAFIDILKIIFLCNVCTSMEDQAQRTAVITHEILNEPCVNPEIRRTLRRLSKQLLHRPAIFTACGFFPLDFTLLFSCIGTVSMFLIILTQFEQSSQP